MTVTVEKSSSSTSAPSTSSELPTTSPSDTDTSTSGEPPRTGDYLSLQHFHMPEGWEEKNYDVANRKQLLGVGTELEHDYLRKVVGLELRPGASYSRLTFETGMAMDSELSLLPMLVRVMTDGKQAELKRVAFGRIQAFDLNIQGVSAVRIRFYFDDIKEYQNASVTPVVFNAKYT